jgi:hypothetical protein
LVALIFGFAGPSGGTGPTIAIFSAAIFSALAMIASVFRLFNFVRFPRSSHRTDSAVPSEHADRDAVRSPR